jgi:hypothetical protein
MQAGSVNLAVGGTARRPSLLASEKPHREAGFYSGRIAGASRSIDPLPDKIR